MLGGPCLQHVTGIITGDPLHSRAACAQPCKVNTHSRAHCSPGARLCEQWGHGCVNNGARLCASARLCRGSPVIISYLGMKSWDLHCVIVRPRSHMLIVLKKVIPDTKDMTLLKCNYLIFTNLSVCYFHSFCYNFKTSEKKIALIHTFFNHPTLLQLIFGRL